jgi:hypothetical protein
LDAPGASAIVASKEYQVFIAPLKEKYPNAFNNTEDTPNVGENFINIRIIYHRLYFVIINQTINYHCQPHYRV